MIASANADIGAKRPIIVIEGRHETPTPPPAEQSKASAHQHRQIEKTDVRGAERVRKPAEESKEEPIKDRMSDAEG